MPVLDTQFSYVDLTWPQLLDFYSLLLTVSLACAWVFFYKFGQFLLSLVLPGREKYDLAWPLAIFTGLWAFPTLVLFGGLLGTFSISFLAFYAVAILAGCWYQGIALLPRLRVAVWFRAEPFAVGACLVATLLLALIGVGHLTPWFDGNYPTAGGHLARTGFYLVSQSDGQPGMVTLVALVNVFFPRMSPLVASVGWGALYAPVLFFGMFFLIRELFGRGKWEALAVLIFLFPVAFKIHEIRASLAGFVLLTWTLLFILRLFRTGRRADFVGAVVTLSATWRNAVLLGALHAGIVSIRPQDLCRRERDARRLIRMLRLAPGHPANTAIVFSNSSTSVQPLGHLPAAGRDARQDCWAPLPCSSKS